jgi:hypothetical protein
MTHYNGDIFRKQKKAKSAKVERRFKYQITCVAHSVMDDSIKLKGLYLVYTLLVNFSIDIVRFIP